MIVIGIDTAIRKTGYGVINAKSYHDISVLDCGVIKNTAAMPHSECLRRIAGGVEELINTFKPDAASIENAFVCKNIKTAMILSLARGAALTMLAIHDVPSFGYAPKTAKKAVFGSGSASKQQVAVILSSIFNLDISKIPDDATDALSLALCHAQVAARPELAGLLPAPI